MPVFYWSFRRDESSDTWANDLGPNFTEFLIQIFGSFNKFLFLILILIYLILSWECQKLNEDRKAFNSLLLIYEYSGGGMDPGAQGKTRKKLEVCSSCTDTHIFVPFSLWAHSVTSTRRERDLTAFQHLQEGQAEERARLLTGLHSGRTRDNGQKMKQEMFKL